MCPCNGQFRKCISSTVLNAGFSKYLAIQPGCIYIDEIFRDKKCVSVIVQIADANLRNITYYSHFYCNIRYPYETHLQLKPREISLAYHIHCSCFIVLIFWLSYSVQHFNAIARMGYTFCANEILLYMSLKWTLEGNIILQQPMGFIEHWTRHCPSLTEPPF